VITWFVKRTAWLFLPAILSLLAGAVLILAAGQNPLLTYANLFRAGFSCQSGPGRCALITALTFATPLILTGLSAMVALRGGFFSIGQAGQMLFGAAAASWLAGHSSLPPGVHAISALVGAALLGGLWGLIPGALKHFIGVNEILSTLFLNPIASVLVGLVWLPGVGMSARLSPLVPSTKLTMGFFLALAAAFLIYVLLWRTTRGLEIRNSGSAPRFALYGGMPRHAPAMLTMTLSGALAGLAGGVEV
jgi:general nucleoside transport system permease protein